MIRSDVVIVFELEDGNMLGRLGIERVEELPLLGVVCWPLLELEPKELWLELWLEILVFDVIWLEELLLEFLLELLLGWVDEGGLDVIVLRLELNVEAPVCVVLVLDGIEETPLPVIADDVDDFVVLDVVVVCVDDRDAEAAAAASELERNAQ